jgi:hypothetical protein
MGVIEMGAYDEQEEMDQEAFNSDSVIGDWLNNHEVRVDFYSFIREADYLK